MKNKFFSGMMVTALVLSSCTPTPTSTPTLLPPTPQGSTLLVASPADSGPGTLRQALQDAQPYDTITFDPTIFPPDAPVTIFTDSELPHIRKGNLTIDASNAGVILDGSKATNPTGEWLTGLQIVDSDANVIRGLHVTHFTGPGIAIAGDANHNIIGGDRSQGSGPFGQGNMLTFNEIGIHLKHKGVSLNTVTGNLIGTDVSGTSAIGNNHSGVFVSEGANRNTIGPDNIIAYNADIGVLIAEGAHSNTVGPGNIIAHNGGSGIMLPFPDTRQNPITQNSIHDNGGRGNAIMAGQSMLLPPLIFNFDIKAGTLSGTTCARCTVEIFSDSSDEGAIYEGKTTADDTGIFTFNKGSSFIGPHLTATVTNLDGNTSGFSRPISGIARILVLQQGNDLPKTPLQLKESRELPDNRMSTQVEARRVVREDYDWVLAELTRLGVKRIRLSFNEFEVPFDPAPTEFTIHPADDAWIESIISNGIALTYVMTFWDKEYQIGGGELGCQRFKGEAEIQRYLEYARFVVRHFRGRIQNFEIWNEPNAGACPQEIEVADYIELVRRTVPVIREENPEAKVIVGAVGAVNWLDDPVAQDYLFTLVSSDVMPMVDGISWHPFYGVSPQYPDAADYYNTYPSLLQKFREVASTAGFRGEYIADELTWWTQPPADKPPWAYSEITAAKYYARGVMLHLGMDVHASPMVGTENRVAYSTVGNLSTVMAGNKPLEIPVEIEGDATNLMSFGFSLPNGDKLFAVWNDGVAVDYDPGIPSTLTFPATSAQKVIGIDVLHGFEQELVIEKENGNLVIRNFLIKDYPIILRLIQ